MKKRGKKLPKEDFELPTKSKMSYNITCPHCKKDSGWNSRDMIHVKGEFNLKCRECGESCAKIMCGKSPGSSEEYLNAAARKYKDPEA